VQPCQTQQEQEEEEEEEEEEGDHKAAGHPHVSHSQGLMRLCLLVHQAGSRHLPQLQLTYSQWQTARTPPPQQQQEEEEEAVAIICLWLGFVVMLVRVI
jgi:hypothetical protein